jgi:YaiO family outer membrane protein
MTFRRTRLGAVLAMVVCVAVPLDGQEDVLTRARGLAVAGQRGDAIALLEVLSAGNADARVLLGTVLSWEGRYAEARQALEAVLADNPTHGDALPALINVELWSSHPGRAEELASRALRNRPNDTPMLLARARALSALDRQTEARDTLDRLLVLDPRDDQARELRRGVRAGLRRWLVSLGASHEQVGDGRAAYREAQVSVSRATPIGAVIVRGVRAQRFGSQDEQLEVEVYPRIRPGTYAYVAGAYAHDAVLFPVYRYAADIYQSLGAGFEGSVGYRRLGFGSGVSIYVASLSKYYGSWLFTGRTFIPSDSVGTSPSHHGSVRRYFGESGASVGLRYGRGAWREELRSLNDFEVLDSDVTAADATIVLRRRVELRVGGAYSREDRAGRKDLRQYSVSTGLGFRF